MLENGSMTQTIKFVELNGILCCKFGRQDCNIHNCFLLKHYSTIFGKFISSPLIHSYTNFSIEKTEKQQMLN